MNTAPGSRSRVASILLSAFCTLATAYGATLSGTALSERGRPVPDLALLVVDRQTQKQHVLATDGAGSFSLELPRGHYAVYAEQTERTTLLAVLTLEPKMQRHIQIVVTDIGVLGFELPPPVSWQETEPAQAPETDPTLAVIRDYRIPAERAESGSRPAARSLAETVNPFPAKKSGGFHGSLYEFHRNDNFDARNFFDPPGEPLPEYKRNQFGVTLGITLGLNMNALVTYEGLRIIQGSTLLSHVPTAAMKQGDFSGIETDLVDPETGQPLPGNRIPESRIHPVAKRLLPLVPDPNQTDKDRNYVNNQPIVRDRDTLTFRVDSQLDRDSKFFARYELSTGENLSAQPLPSFGSVHDQKQQDAALSYNRKISDRSLASLRFDFNRNASFVGSVNAGNSGLLASLGIRGLSVDDPADEGYPDFRFSGYASFGDAFLPVSSVMNRYQVEAALSYNPENHNVRLGFEYEVTQSNDNRSDGIRKGRFSFSGYYSGDAFADFMLGIPDSASRGVGSDRADLRRNSWNLYFRDQWKLGPKLSLNLGLTYSRYPPFRSVHNNISGFFPLLFEPPLDGRIVVAGSEEARAAGLARAGPGGLVLPDRNDWAPSVGLAYSPFGSKRLAIRGSYAIFHSPAGLGYFVNYLGRNTPFYYVESAQASIDRPALDLSSPFDTAVATELGIRGIEPGLRTAYHQAWQLSVAAEVFGHWNLSGSYRGDRGTRMPRVLAGNVPLPDSGPIQPRRPNPSYGRFSIVTGSGSFSRNWLGVSAERRMSGGIALRTGFDWGRSFNDLFRGFPSDPRNLSAERAPADFLSQRQLSLNYIVDLPFGRNARFLRGIPAWTQAIIGGWRLSGITRIESGDPFSIILAGDQNNDGVSGDRPDRLITAGYGGSRRSVDGWFDITAFSSPGAYSFGNSGRNILIGPDSHNWDVSVIKQARFTDGNLLEIRLELFNAFNHPNFEQPYSVYGTSVFGKVFGARRAREIEVALRYSF